jgi:hypothetical protein
VRRQSLNPKFDQEFRQSATEFAEALTYLLKQPEDKLYEVAKFWIDLRKDKSE